MAARMNSWAMRGGRTGWKRICNAPFDGYAYPNLQHAPDVEIEAAYFELEPATHCRCSAWTGLRTSTMRRTTRCLSALRGQHPGQATSLLDQPERLIELIGDTPVAKIVTSGPA
jgi:hypothetical protein